MIIKLGSHLPDGDKNGLVRIAPALVDDPHGAHVVIAVVDCKQLNTNTDDDTVTPLARIRHLEPLASAEDVAAATALLRRAFEQRTGKVELPFDMTQDQERVLIKDRDELPDAADVVADQQPADVDKALPPEPAGDVPEWEQGYPEGEGATAPAEAEEGVRAFASPFRPSGS